MVAPKGGDALAGILATQQHQGVAGVLKPKKKEKNGKQAINHLQMQSRQPGTGGCEFLWVEMEREEYTHTPSSLHTHTAVPINGTHHAAHQSSTH